MPKTIAVSQVKECFAALAEVPDDQLQFLINESTLSEFPQDSFLFEANLPADNMILILKGHFKVFIMQQGQKNIAAELNAGDITGILPFSRMQTSTAAAQTTEEGLALLFPRSLMRILINEHYELTEALVHLMNARIRTFTTMQQQNERMMSLGKLSAGLAHELNNPSAAIARSVKVLSKKGDEAKDLIYDILRLPKPMRYLELAQAIILELKQKEKAQLSLLDRQEKEDDWQDYFEDQDLPNCGELVEQLTEYDLEPEFLEEAFQKVGPEAKGPLMRYLEFELSRQELLKDIEIAAERISGLVGSVKNFTHMDQAQDKSLSHLSAGLDSTLKMLEHKVKKQSITVLRDYDSTLAQVPIFAGQMNQVFTNILDNAIDALKGSENPEIRIKTYRKHNNAYVKISDNGPGIPDAIATQVFDPFFTTKAVGEGTGMGLELSRRIIDQHKGKLNLESNGQPTIFTICLPFEA
jgi:signal transduction histidine kinase